MTNPSAAARRLGFRVLDGLKGSPIQRRLTRIHERMEASSAGDEARQQALSTLLSHASSTTDYYADFEGAELTDFPVVGKLELRKAGDALLSSDFRTSALTVASTTGSTGTPFKVYQDVGKRQARSAEAIYFGTMAGFTAGQRLYLMKIWSERNRKSLLAQSLLNITPVDVVSLSISEMTEVARKVNGARHPVAILAYPSALERIARHIEGSAEAGNLVSGNVTAIITQSEGLSDPARAAAERAFGVRPTARYGAEEVGIIGQETNGHLGYCLNRSNVHVEILQMHADVETGAGELGRIVVTDLNNFGSPVVRYDTGDVGRFSVDSNGSVDRSVLSAVEGRRLDQIYSTTGNHVSPFIFYKCIWKHPEIIQFQLIQFDIKSYRLMINAPRRLDDDGALVDDFKAYLGWDANFTIQYIDEIPLLDSGKRQQVVNEMS